MNDAEDISLLRTPIWEGNEKSQIAEPSAEIEGDRRSCSEATIINFYSHMFTDEAKIVPQIMMDKFSDD